MHNSFVVEDLKKIGIRKISRIKPALNSILIIRAHGAGQKTFEKARLAGYSIVDATCPKVKAIYKIAQNAEKHSKIIIIGDNNHAEVKGIAGQLKTKPLTIENSKHLPLKKLSRIKKAAVITQSTQTIENITDIMRHLKRIIPEVTLFDTTCRAFRIKQQEIRSMPKENDLMLIIGSKQSANTKRLYQISKSINKKTYWIEHAKELNRNWFKSIKSTGIMSGASTPDHITQEVVELLSRKKTTKTSGKR